MRLKRTSLLSDWQSIHQYKEDSRLKRYAPLLAVFAERFAHWPTIFEYNQIIAEQNLDFRVELQPHVGQRKKRRIRKQEKNTVSTIGYYLSSVIERKVIPTRQENWHDFFNLIVWMKFPKTRLLLHELFFEETLLPGFDPGKRSAKASWLTSFDEGGSFVCAETGERIIIGHGLIECFLAGYEDINSLTLHAPLCSLELDLIFHARINQMWP